MKKKIDSQKKGRVLEEILEDLIGRVLKEWGFRIVEIRPEQSGYQFGRDNVSSWIGDIDGQEYEFKWALESKNRGSHKRNAQIPPLELMAKFAQIQWAVSNGITIDSWCIFSPFGTIDNQFRQMVRESNDSGKLPFRITFFTFHHQIEDLIACFPDIYEELYKRKKNITKKQRMATLSHWKQLVIQDTKLGKTAREKNTNSQTINLSTESINAISHVTAKRVTEIRNDISEKVSQTNSLEQVTTSTSGVVEDAKLQERIDEARKVLDSTDFQGALLLLLPILAETRARENFEKKRATIYNNIGVAYNGLGLIDKAIENFRLSLEQQPDFSTAITNLANAHISKSEILKDEEAKEELEKAEKIIDQLMKDPSASNEPRAVHAQLRLIRAQKGLQELLRYIEEKEKTSSNSIFHSNATLAFFIGSMYLEGYAPEKALQYAETSVSLEEDVEFLALRGRSQLLLALRDDTSSQYESIDDLAPHFKSKKRLKKALADFKKASEVAVKTKKTLFDQEVDEVMRLANLWLGEETSDSKKTARAEGKVNSFIEAVEAFRERRFEASFEMLKKTPGFEELPTSEIYRFARAYLFNGAVEIAKNIFNQLEESVGQNSSQYWLDRSMIEVLLDNKNQAILSVNRAVLNARSPEQKRIAFSHMGAVLLRYSVEDGGDRMLKHALAFEKEFPELPILTRFDAEKDQGKIVEMIQERRNWATNIIENYKSHPIPSYYLEKVFKKPYIEVWSGRDPQSPMEYTITSDVFLKELEENRKQGEVVVLDYAALLTITKLDLISSLDKLFKHVVIPFSLFQKVQDELLQVENPTLRKLWSLLSGGKVIKIEKKIPKKKLINGRINDLFDQWLVDCIKLAKNKGVLLLTDDFRLYRFSKSENIVPINSWFILNEAKRVGHLDEIMYSKAIGILGGCFYTFIGFSGDDLFQIVADDNFELKARSYHLINQVFLPGAYAPSFTNTLIKFIKNIWSAGILTKDKVFWLSHITQVCTDIIKNSIKLGLPKEIFELLAVDAALIWNVAVSSGNLEDLKYLRREVDKILENQSLESIKPTIFKKIDEEIEKLKSKKEKKANV